MNWMLQAMLHPGFPSAQMPMRWTWAAKDSGSSRSGTPGSNLGTACSSSSCSSYQQSSRRCLQRKAAEPQLGRLARSQGAAAGRAVCIPARSHCSTATYGDGAAATWTRSQSRTTPRCQMLSSAAASRRPPANIDQRISAVQQKSLPFSSLLRAQRWWGQLLIVTPDGRPHHLACCSFHT